MRVEMPPTAASRGQYNPPRLDAPDEYNAPDARNSDGNDEETEESWTPGLRREDMEVVWQCSLGVDANQASVFVG